MRSDGSSDKDPSQMRIYVPMTGWRLTRWLMLYLAMILLDAAMALAVI